MNFVKYLPENDKDGRMHVYTCNYVTSVETKEESLLLKFLLLMLNKLSFNVLNSRMATYLLRSFDG